MEGVVQRWAKVGISNCSVVEWKRELKKAPVSWALQGTEMPRLRWGAWSVLFESQEPTTLRDCCLRLTNLGTRLTKSLLGTSETKDDFLTVEDDLETAL